jgi:hypothetical protein
MWFLSIADTSGSNKNNLNKLQNETEVIALKIVWKKFNNVPTLHSSQNSPLKVNYNCSKI